MPMAVNERARRANGGGLRGSRTGESGGKRWIIGRANKQAAADRGARRLEEECLGRQPAGTHNAGPRGVARGQRMAVRLVLG